jgi:2-polyprenyl-6-methoxyphenol hydroxylase-like FAD-dependent oxidoreductase
MIKFCRKSFSVLRPDICIVGAGPAGAALACALASSNKFNPQAEKRIVLVDPSSLPDIKTY